MIFSPCADQKFEYSTVTDSVRGWKTDTQEKTLKTKTKAPVKKVKRVEKIVAVLQMGSTAVPVQLLQDREVGIA